MSRRLLRTAVLVVGFYVLLTLLTTGARAEGWGLGIKQVELTYQTYVNKRSPLLPEIGVREWGEHVEVRPELTFLRAGFFDSTWYFDTAYSKVMEVGLRFDTGFHVTEWASLVYSHHSYHSSDVVNSFYPNKGYGLEDRVGVRLRFTP